MESKEWVEPEPVDGLALEPLRQPPEGIAILVDDSHRVAPILEGDRQLGADPPTPHDDDVHCVYANTGGPACATWRRIALAAGLRPPSALTARVEGGAFDVLRSAPVYQAIKRLLLGRPLRGSEEHGQKLPKKVALATAWISSVDPRRQQVVMNIDKKRIEEGPDYSEEHVLDRDYETRLHAHYQYPPYWI